jgi:hypothetical protein
MLRVGLGQTRGALRRAAHTTAANVRGKDDDPFVLLTSSAEEISKGREQGAQGLLWKLFQTKTVRPRWAETSFVASRSFRFPGVFFVDVDEATAREIGAEGMRSTLLDSHADPRHRQMLSDKLMPENGMVRLWTYRLHLNTWMGERRLQLLTPPVSRWFFATEWEAAFARDYRLFRDVMDVHSAMGFSPPKTRGSLTCHRFGREQSPFCGVALAPHTTDRWRYRQSWGDSPLGGRYILQDGDSAITSQLRAAGLRERSFRHAVLSGGLREFRRTPEGHFQSEPERRFKAAKLPYCNFGPVVRLPGESLEEYRAWLESLRQRGFGQPTAETLAGVESTWLDLGGASSGAADWSDWSHRAWQELQSTADVSQRLSAELDRLWTARGLAPFMEPGATRFDRSRLVHSVPDSTW